MRIRTENAGLWLVMGTLLIAGCGDDAEWDAAEEPGELVVELPSPAVDAAEPMPVTPVSQSSPAQRRFPMQKRVEHTLTQDGRNGPMTLRSTLELLFDVGVESGDGPRRRLSVHYRHVRYEQDGAGQGAAAFFDSNSPPAELPAGLLPYQGMVGQGFAFLIGGGEPVELIGFEEFLQKCLRDVPPELRTYVRQNAASAAESSVAEFVDFSVGMLPPEFTAADAAPPAVGQSWPIRTLIGGTLPMSIDQRCEVVRATEQTLEVAMAGRIAPLGPPNMNTDDGVQIALTGGRSRGQCTLDLHTRLPLHAEFQHELDMRVSTADGQVVQQRKHIKTVIRAYPLQIAGSTSAESEAISPAGFERR